MFISLLSGKGSFDCVVVRFARANSAQDDKALRYRSNGNWLLITIHCPLLHMPGSFIPASLLAKLGLPICLNIFFI